MKIHETIDDLLNAKEGENYQFKEWKNKDDLREAARICCALANCGASVSSSVPQALATNAWDTLDLNDRHKQILAYMVNNAKTTTAQLKKHTGLSDGRIRKLFIELAQKDVIKKMGDNRYTHYIIKNADE